MRAAPNSFLHRVAFCTVFFFAAMLVSPAPTRAADSLDPFLCAGGAALDGNAALNELRSVQRAYGSIKTFRALFSQQAYLASLDTSELSGGQVLFATPGRMLWRYKTPEEQLFLINGQTVWFYQPADRQVTIDNFDRVVISELPVAFLMGLGRLEDDFAIAQACRGQQRGIERSLIFVLTPKSAVRPGKETSAEQNLRAFTLAVDNETHVPRGARIVDVAGNTNSIHFDKIELNPKLTDNEFRLSYPPGTDINDRRSGQDKR